MIALRAGSATDVGLVRTNNQDSYLLADPLHLFAVADGMGGHAAGEVASAVAVQALETGFGRTSAPKRTAEDLSEAAQKANKAVWDEAEANPDEMHGMGTTLVALALVEGPQLAIINIGDSRLYGFHDSELRQITTDHNLVAELVAEGRISKEEAEVHPRRNIMTRALGVEPEVPVDLFVEEPVAGDRYLLCSDGLPREVSDDLIASVLSRLADPDDAAKELVAEAKRRGGNDNITVVIVDVVEAEEKTADKPAKVGGAAAVIAAAAAGAEEKADEKADEKAAGEQADTAVLPSLNAGDTTVLPLVTVDDGDGDPGGAATTAASAQEPAAAPDADITADLAATDEDGKKRKWKRAKKEKTPKARQARAINVRVVAFIVGILIVLAAAAGGVIWYARSGYFVGLKDKQIVIFQGRPGGVLWFQPTVAFVTPHTTADVLPVAIPELAVGQQESSISAARAYVANLVELSAEARRAEAPPNTKPPSTTVPPTTARPTTPTTRPAAASKAASKT